MTLAFRAHSVTCTNTIGGDILQVCFDTMPLSCDEEKRDTPYILISANFECPGPATIEWHDGTAYDGGGEIVSLVLRRDQVWMKLDRGLEIEVSFSLGDRWFAQLRAYLTRMLDEGVLAAT